MISDSRLKVRPSDLFEYPEGVARKADCNRVERCQGRKPYRSVPLHEGSAALLGVVVFAIVVFAIVVFVVAFGVVLPVAVLCCMVAVARGACAFGAVVPAVEPLVVLVRFVSKSGIRRSLKPAATARRNSMSWFALNVPKATLPFTAMMTSVPKTMPNAMRTTDCTIICDFGAKGVTSSVELRCNTEMQAPVMPASAPSASMRAS